MLIKMNISRILKASMLLLLVLACPLSVSVPPAQAANASDFKPGRLIDDSTFTNQNSMSASSIQAFLNSKVSTCQAGYTCLKDYTQNGKSAAQIIFDKSQEFSINPQTMLVLLQKEQILVTDTWPTPTQYTKATGFGCPDSSLSVAVDANQNGCYDQYEGFTNQVHYAARMFRRIMNNDPAQYQGFSLGNNNVQYHPNTACGAPNVFIENRATIALYTYTPYQPNPAALANLYGTGDGCSAYGNRNFWRMFNDWFGPSTGEGFSLMTSFNDNGDGRQWVVTKGVKRHVPSEEILRAWGLDQLPLAQTTGLFLGAIPTSGQLDRLMRPTGSQDVYFVDSRNAYRITSTEMLNTWGLNPSAIADVGVDLARLPTNQGNFSYALRKYNNLAVYMMDGGTLRQYGNGDVLTAWEGDSPKIVDLSSDYSAKLSTVGSMVSVAKAKNVSSLNQYNVVAGQKLYLSSGVAPLYPGAPATVSDLTINRLTPSAQASHFIRYVGAPTVYMVDTQKHAVGSPELIRAWGVGANPEVNVVSQGNINLLATGGAVNTFEADVAGQLYLMDGRKITIPTSLDSGYRTSGNVYSPSAELMALLPAGETASSFLKGFQTAPVYLMDQGSIRHVRTGYDLSLLSNNEGITSVSDYVLGQFAHGGYVGSYLSSGGTNYAVAGGNKYTVDTTTASDWNLSSPDAVNATTIARYSGSSALSRKVKIGSSYYWVRDGKSHLTFNTDLAGVWGLTSSPNELNNTFMQRVSSSTPLTIFVRSTDTNDQRIFIADSAGAQLHHLTSPDQVFNYGYQSGGQMLLLSPSDITAGSPVTAKNIIKKASGGDSVLDSGAKRLFSNGTIQGNWETGSNVATVSDALWAFIPAGSNINRTIKGTSPNVYVVDGGNKRWVQSDATYQSYAPYQSVSNYLINLLPNGADLP